MPTEEPLLREVAPGHQVACHFPVGPAAGQVAPAGGRRHRPTHPRLTDDPAVATSGRTARAPAR